MSTTVTGNLRNLLGTAYSSGAFVRFYLRGCRGNQPTIIGTGALAPTQGPGQQWYVDLVADGSGNISGTLYSTRAADGTSGGDISIGGSLTAASYGMVIYNQTIAGPEVPIHAKSGVTLDISNVTPITTIPVITAGSGDSTYLRLDGGNSPLTGPVSSSSSLQAASVISKNYPVVDVTAYGAVGNGVTDDYTAINNAITAAGRGGTVFFPAGKTFAIGTTITITTNLRIIGNGARLKFTGAGKIIYLHGGVETDGLEIHGLILQGNPSATYGLYCDTLFARGSISIINIQDVATAGAYLADIQLMNLVDITVSALKASVMGTAQVTTPASGVILGDTGKPFSNNRVCNFSTEGTGGVGLWLKNAGNGNVFYGTAEANAGPNLQIETGASGNVNNTFIGFDTEAATNSIDIVDKGSGTHYINITSTTSIHLTGANSPIFDGGLTNDFLDDGNSKSVIIRNLSYGNFGGTITMSGNDSNWSFEHLFHANVLALSETLPFRVTMLDIGSPSNTDNFEFVPEFTGLGYLELFKHTPNQAAHSGTLLQQFDNSGNVNYPSVNVTVGGKATIASSSGTVTKYGNVTTAGQGVVPVYAVTSQKAEASSVDTNVLTLTPPAAAGTYRIHFILSLSAANAATLGWTATWKDSNGAAQAPTNLSLFQSGAAAPALTFTTSVAGNYYGSAIIDIDNSATNVVVKLTFSGTSFAGKASATIERLN